MFVFFFLFSYAIFGIDLTSDGSSGCEYNSMPLTGSLILTAQFSKPVPANAEMLVMLEYGRVLTINSEFKPSFVTATPAAMSMEPS